MNRFHDWLRERRIDYYHWRAVRAAQRHTDYRMWWERMQEEVIQRSAEQVSRMEKRKGISA